MTEYAQKIRVNRVAEPKVRIRVKPRVPPLEIGMQNTGIVVQWRLGTTGTWVDLIEIDDINASVSIGTVTTLAAGTPAYVTNVGTAQDVILDFGVPTGGVTSVNGEIGVVVIDAGDIAFTPAGNIAATTVQTAIEELAGPPETLIVTSAGAVSVAADIGAVLINKSAPSATPISLPAVSTRYGLALKVSDFAGNGGDVTITPFGAETIMGLSTAILGSFGPGVGSAASITLYPSTALSGWYA